MITQRLTKLAFTNLLFLFLGSFTGIANAYPVLDQVKGLPNPELVTVYPDDVNKNLYYFVPTAVALVYDTDTQKPRLGVQYWGLTGVDPSGIGAALTFSVKPAFQKDTVDSVATGLKKINPNASFAFPTLVSSQMEMILNGMFVAEKQDNNQPQVKGGTVDAAQVFTIGLNRIGAIAFAQGVADNTNLLGARYTYKFTGVAKQLHAKVTIYHKKVYDHFKAQASSKSWWGLVTSHWSADWQKLTNDGSIKLDILEGGETDKDAYILEVFKTIVNAKINETGMFAPKLQPAGISAGGGESSLFGWSFSGGGGWEHLEENVNYEFSINTKKLEDREFNVGLSFSAVCAKYPDSFADLTTIGNKCIDAAKMATVQSAEQKCIEAKLSWLGGLLNKKLISQAVYDQQEAKTLNEPCYSNVAAATTNHASAATFLSDVTGTSKRDECLTSRVTAINSSIASAALDKAILEPNLAQALKTPCTADQASDDVFAAFTSSHIRTLEQLFHNK